MKWFEEFLIKYGFIKRHCAECGAADWQLEGYSKRPFRRCKECDYCEWLKSMDL